MKPFRKYAESLDTLLDEIEWGNRLINHECEVDQALNGQAADALRKLASVAQIREAGAFFTGPRLADLAISRITQVPGILKQPVYDPTCGAGDLLLRWADALPICQDLQTTIQNWERFIVGHDLFPEFLDVTRRRLVLKAIIRGARLKGGRPPKVDRLFPGLEARDARFQEPGDQIQTIVMNPPFNMVTAQDDCEWSSGRVSLAAQLFYTCLQNSVNKTRIVAILPDVLRAGSRYERWREIVAKKLRIQGIRIYGRFDSHADVDVFIIEGTVCNQYDKPVSWWAPDETSSNGRTGDQFHVSVGAVVPHRDPHLGPWAPFATSKTISPWTENREVCGRRRFPGTKVDGPFVVVRRTSGPRDAQRAIGSIVTDSKPIAVENHLLVLRPYDGSRQTCQSMVSNLKDPRTNVWLNARIRCRHLTVGVMRELPIWENSK